jgi:hypothetical protein
MAEHRYAARNVLRHVPLLVQFGAFTAGRGARHLKELPEHVDAFVAEYLRTHDDQPRPDARGKVAWFARTVVEQMLRVALPDLVMSNRSPAAGPAGFLVYRRSTNPPRHHQPDVPHPGSTAWPDLGGRRFSAARAQFAT